MSLKWYLLIESCINSLLYDQTPAMKNKNAAEVNIAPASGKIIENVKNRSRAPGQGVPFKGLSMTISMQSFTLAATLGAEKIKQ